jgi:acid stress-induced BolA-like protein IbaG/YrbA
MTFQSVEDVCKALREAIEGAIPGSHAQVTPGNPGHFEVSVRSSIFAGQSMVRQQQMVYSAIAHLMQGEDAPVHAIDRLRTSPA